MNTAPDTIVALSTPSGQSALALVRLSGALSLDIGREALRREKALEPRLATTGHYRDTKGTLLDQVVITGYAAGKSFTGEPMLEISCHGNPVIAQQIIEDCVKRGVRIAQPGEFTRRAFLNGKLDLTQAEAVGDLIHARSELALQMARNQLRGAIGEWVGGASQNLLEIIAQLEAYIDFPDEDLPEEDPGGPVISIEKLDTEIDKILKASHFRDLVADGIKVVILGAPNAGKSSLINKLVGEERVLVSPEPGTTRDYIRERMLLGPHCIQIMDTAGIHHTENALETQGIRKTLDLVQEADFHLLVLDTTLPFPEFPDAVLEHLRTDNCLVLENKIDLPESVSMGEILPALPHLRVSLKTDSGWQLFLDQLESTLSRSAFTPPADLILVNARHASALESVRVHLQKARELIRSQTGPEWVVAELRVALDAFGEVIGKVDNEAMLDILFQNFCIGK